MKQRLHYWKSEGHRCPKCQCTTFYVDKESHIVPTIFGDVCMPLPEKRITIICTQCGSRYYPETVIK